MTTSSSLLFWFKATNRAIAVPQLPDPNDLMFYNEE
jgi:hypothetical protein